METENIDIDKFLLCRIRECPLSLYFKTECFYLVGAIRMPGVGIVKYAMITGYYNDAERYSEYNCGNKHCARCLI